MRDEATKGKTSGTVRWFHEERVDDAVTFRAGKRGSDLIADWPGFATLTCAPDGTSATLVAVDGVAPKEIVKLRHGQVRALLRDLAGGLTLHASAVGLEGGAVLFVGPTGAGKSTAAAEMCLRHGALLLADDVTSLDVGPGGVFVLPGEAEHWLTQTSQEALGLPACAGDDGCDKREISAARVAREPAPLALLVALRTDPLSNAPTFRALRGGDAARLLLKSSIRFDVEDAAARQREFDQVTRIHARTPCWELVRSLRRPAMVGEFIMDALREAAS